MPVDNNDPARAFFETRKISDNFLLFTDIVVELSSSTTISQLRASSSLLLHDVSTRFPLPSSMKARGILPKRRVRANLSCELVVVMTRSEKPP